MRRWVGRHLRRMATLLRGEGAQREVEEEMRLHVELEAEELIRQGMTPSAARREALRRFGGVDRHREAVREARGVARLQDGLQDVRLAVRTLARTPAFTAVALLALALGIGCSTAIFSVVHAVLLRPLPYAQPERLLRVHSAWEGTPVARLSPAEYVDLSELDVFQDLGVYAFATVNLTGDGEPERLRAALLSHGVLPSLDVPPLLGRRFTLEEDETAARVTILSHGLWRRRFGGDPTVIGRTVHLNGSSYQVVGVLPPTFSLPEDLARVEPSALYLPMGLSPAADLPRGSHLLFGVGRLAPGVDADAASAAVVRAGERMVEWYPDAYPREMAFRTAAPSLHEEVLGPERPALRRLAGAVLVLLLITCSNVANLLLARAEGRERELGLRRALGARRGRLFRQVMVESVVLGLFASLLGVAVAAGSIEVLLSLQPPEVPRLQEVRIDAPVLLFAVGLSVVTGIAFGLLPAGRASRGDPLESFRGGGTRGDAGTGRVRAGLVVTQLAATVVLLTGGALLGGSFLGLLRSDPGYRTTGILTAQVTLPADRYPEPADVSAFFRTLRARLEALPGVVGAGAVSQLPLATSLGDLDFRIEGRPVVEGDVSPRADLQVVTAGYLEAMGVRILEGRSLDERDRADAPGGALISRTTAERYWPEQPVLGARFVLGGGAGPGAVTVVGVVEDVAHGTLDGGPSAQMYLSHEQFRFWNSPVRAMDLVVRARGEPGELAPLLRAEVRALDASLPVASVRTMEEVVSASLAEPRLLASLMAAFAAIALVLSTVGIYGVIAYTVGQRRREIGIRMALGAAGSRVLAMVLRDGARMVAAGLLLGIAGAVLLGRAAEGAPAGDTAPDAVILAAVSAILGLVAMLACLAPAWRAMRTDPVEPLRGE